jgi:hypothetical protein
MVEMNGAVAIKTTITLRKCAKECSENDKCVTLFYNHNSGYLILKLILNIFKLKKNSHNLASDLHISDLKIITKLKIYKWTTIIK